MNCYRPFLALAILSMSSCDRSQENEASVEWWKIEGEKRKLGTELEIAQLRIADLEHQDSEVQEIKESRKELSERLRSLQSELAELRQGNADLRSAIQIVANAKPWLERHAELRGDHLESLTSAEGRTYHDVQITRVTGIGLEFRHSEGVARLAASDLTLEQRQFFQLDLQRSAALLSIEREKQAALARNAASQTRSTRVAEPPQPTRPRLTFPETASRAPLVSTSPLDEPARPLGNSRYGYSPRSTRYYYVWNTGSPARRCASQTFRWPTARSSTSTRNFRPIPPRVSAPRCPND